MSNTLFAMILAALDWREVGEDIIRIAAVLTAIAVIAKKVMDAKAKAAQAVIHSIKDVFDEHIFPKVEERLDTKLADALEPIKRELSFNGGSTVKDKVCKLDDAVSEANIRLTEVHKMISRRDIEQEMADRGIEYNKPNNTGDTHE